MEGGGGTREGNIFPLTPPQLVSGHRDMYVCTCVCNKQTHTHKQTLYVRQRNFPMYATFISNMELKNHKRNVSQKTKTKKNNVYAFKLPVWLTQLVHFEARSYLHKFPWPSLRPLLQLAC